MNGKRAPGAQWLPLAFLALSGVAMSPVGDGFPRWFVAGLLAGALVIGVCAATVRLTDMLGVLALSVPLQDLGAVDAFVTTSTLTKLCVTCIAIGWTIRLAAGKRVSIDSVAWAYMGVVVALAVSIVARSNAPAWAGETYRWAIAGFIFVVARSEMTERSHVHRVLVGVAAGVIGVSFVAIRQVAMTDGPPSFVVNGVLRAYGTFGQPNPLAAYLELSLPILIAVTFVPLAHRRSLEAPSYFILPAMVAITGGAVGLALTQSRGGWLGFAAAGLVLLGGFPPRARVAVAVGASAALACVLSSGMGTALTDRLASLSDAGSSRVHVTPENWSNQERRAHWGAALNMFRAFPWTGVGAGGFDDAYREYTSDWRFRVNRGHAHNGYLQMAAQAGVAGLIGFTCWVGTIALRAGRRARESASVSGDARALGGFATIVACAVHSMVDYVNVLSIGIHLALVIAISLADLPASPEMMIEGPNRR